MTGLTNSDLQSMSFAIEGDVNVQVTITELASGDLQFDLFVLDDTGTIGDMQGLFFDLVDPSILDGLAVTGSDVTAAKFDEGEVDNLGGGVNVKGELTQDEGFDAGVRFGTSGMSKDDIQETSFTLSHDGLDLMIDDFFGADFGVRLTSVGEEDGSRDGSLKLGGTAPNAPEDEPEQPPTDDEPEQPPTDDMPPMDDEPEQPPTDDMPAADEPVSGLVVPDDPMSALATGEVYDEDVNPDYMDDEHSFDDD